MEKSEKKKRQFFNEEPQNLFKLINSVSSKIFESHPFNFLTSKTNKEFAEFLIKKCDVSEKIINKIISDSFAEYTIIIEAIGKDHEASEQGEAIVKGYTEAIEALERAAGHVEVIHDKTFKGSSSKGVKNMREALLEDVDELKKKRASWAHLCIVHPELKGEPVPISAINMFTHQAYNLFVYIEKCIEKSESELRGMKQKTYSLISELFMAIYDHPAFNAAAKFTPKKINKFCDNIRTNKHREKYKKKTTIRKYIESL